MVNFVLYKCGRGSKPAGCGKGTDIKLKTKLELLCEGISDPVGIDTAMPELSWQEPKEGIRQAACRIWLGHREHTVWDSGWVKTANSRHTVPVSLGEKKKYYWKVWIRDETGKEIHSGEAVFRTGIFDPLHWKASFITGGTLLRKEFELEELPAFASLSFTGLGYCEAWINGKKVGNNVLFPSYTIYKKTVEYMVEDITAHIKKGANVIGLMLGGHWKLDEDLRPIEVYSDAFYQGQCTGLCQLDLEMEDGRQITLGSDETWHVSMSPVTFSSIFDGEHYDARLEQDGWCTPEFNAMGWKKAAICSEHLGKLRYSYTPPIRVIEDIPAHSIQKKQGEWILDFGQNFAGRIKIHIQEEAGQKVTIRHGEVLYEDGTLNTENLRNAKATDLYICRGGTECYEPHFTYHGFRYVSIRGLSHLSLEDVSGRVVHSSNSFAGDFHCSKEAFNRIYRAMVWTMRSNMHSIPTDCCQRDERQGWMADAGVSSEFGVLNFDLTRFYRKWFQDIRDTQLPDGSLPLAGAPGWPRDTFIWKTGYHMTLRSLYLYTGDIRAVRENYTALQKYESYLHSTLKDGLISYDFYNDWLAIEFANNLMISNSFLVDFYNAMFLFAQVMEDKDGMERYRKRKEALVSKINDAFYGWCLDNPLGTGYYGTCDTVAAAPSAMALEYGIVPKKLQKKVEDALLWLLIYSRGSIQFPTGILTSGILMDCLSHTGHDDIAYCLLDREDYPSLRFMLAHGATTIWERWQYMTGNEMNSHNHPALCSLGTWFFKSLCGLRQIIPRKDGTAWIKLQPYLPKDMDEAQMSLQTHWGLIRLEWEKKNQTAVYRVSLPGRVSGEAELPNGRKERLAAGKFVFEWESQ